MGDGRTLPVRCGQDGEISTKTPKPQNPNTLNAPNPIAYPSSRGLY